MAIVTTDDKHYKNIANALRRNLHYASSKPYKPSEMADAVDFVYTAGYERGDHQGYSVGYDTGLNAGKTEMHNLWLNRALTEVNGTAENIGRYQFLDFAKLTTANFPNAVSAGMGCFEGCSVLEIANFPMISEIPERMIRSTNVPRFDAHVATSVGATAFAYTSSFRALILRNNTLATLTNKNAFTSSLVATGDGYIYVPSALLEEYKAATNWSTYANQFRAIEDYPNLDSENALQIVQQPVDVAWMLNESASFTVDAIGDGVKYRWYIDMQDGNGWVKSVYNSYASSTHTLTMFDGRQGWQFYCEVTDEYGHMVKSNIVTMG